MEEKRRVYIYVKGDHKFGKNKYILGRISGIKHVVCEEHGKVAHGHIIRDGCWVYPVDCTETQLETLRNMLEGLYPGLCEFK